MVICTDYRLAIGERPTVGTLTDVDRVPHQQPFTVIRPATREDYENFCRREWGYMGELPARTYYYLVAID